MKEHFDIFISYRREGGLELADSIYQRLINAGYSAFLDLEQLNSGKFNTKLIGVIEQCQDFILVLPPDALDRCADEDDWVRQEVECALKHKKNIIPIMLRGFEWPAVESLPASLRDLPNYNGISASDHNVFVENVERLKRNFLESKPGITWRRYRKIAWPLIAVVVIVLGVVAGMYFTNHKKYGQLSNEIAMSMMTEIVKLNNNILAAEGVLENWKEFVKDYDEEELAYLQKDIQEAVDHADRNLQAFKPLEFSEEELSVLRKNGVEIEELEAFSLYAETMHDDVDAFLENFILFSNTPVNDYIAELPEYSYQSLVLSLKGLYYGTLAIYKTLPVTIYDKLYQVTPQLALLSDIPLSLTKEDYEAHQQGVMMELERVVGKMRANTNDLKGEVELMEQKQMKMEEDLQKMYVEKRLQDVDEKRAAIAKRKAEVAEADRQLADLYLDALKKFELQPTDDQWEMWGKIVRIAKLAQISKKSEEDGMRQHEELVAVAKEKGISTDHLVAPMYSITAKDKYQNVDKWLIRYKELNPSEDVAVYAEAARAYYKAVASSHLDPEVGIILVATKDNERHPVYQIGDIVIERAGTPINTADQYFAMSDDPKVRENNEVKVLRLTNGRLVEKTLVIPADCSVLVGFSELHE